MTQLALFQQGQTDRQDICRRKHGGDPASVEAHRRTNKEDRYAAILEHLEKAALHGRTLDELSHLLGVHPNQISGRITELRVAGRIRRTDERRQTETGSWASVYEDAIAEGVTLGQWSDHVSEWGARWTAINGKESWEQNPYVWVLTFRKVAA